MKKESNDLFQLIKSLTRNEKGYFKKYHSRYSSQKSQLYLKVFDAFDKAPDTKRYDESMIVKKLPLSLQNSFTSKKHYLYNSIIDALCAYYSEQKTSINLKEKIIAVEILMDKGLLSQAHKYIKRILSIAEKQESYAVCIELFKYKRKIIASESKPQIPQIEALMESEMLYIDKLNREAVFSNYNTLIGEALFKKTEGIADKKALSLIKKWVSKIPPIKSSDSIKAHFLYYSIKASYYLALGNSKKTYENRKKALDCLERHPILSHFIRDYLWTLNSIVIEARDAGYVERTEPFIKKLKEIANESREKGIDGIHIKIFQQLPNTELDILIKQGSAKKAYQKYSEYKKLLPLYEDKCHLSTLKVFYFNFAIICFMNHDYEEALEWCNKSLNSKNIKQMREGVQIGSKMLNLMIHIELENFHLVEHFAQAFLRTKINIDVANTTAKSIKDYAVSEGKNLQPIKVLKQYLAEQSFSIFEDSFIKELRLTPWCDEKLGLV